MDSDDSDTNRAEMWYYRDTLQCFVPSCLKYRRDFPNSVFLCIPKCLKATWCQALNRNCPKRGLYVCGDHINIGDDCYIGKSGKIHLHKTANLILTSTTSHIDKDVDTIIQREIIKRKSVQNFKVHKIKGMKLVPYQLSHLPDTEKSPLPSVSVYASSDLESTTSSSSIKYDEKVGRNHLLKIIKNKPKMYLGLPKNFWWAINFISEQYSCLALHIIMTLFKIKNNDTFVRMSGEFEMARSTIRIMFESNVFVLAAFFKILIFLPSLNKIKRNMPLLAFRNKNSNIHIIIDCFEIQIEKPSDPTKQAQTWSQYKSRYTIKYLIGCTPAGFILFISNGYGGRISDEAIIQKSGFIDILPSNAVIIADVRFKKIEALLITKNVKLHSSKLLANISLVKNKAIETTVIASLKVNIIKKVIRKVREFHMLKLGSVVNHKHLRYLDEIVLIACGLTNLQGPVI